MNLGDWPLEKRKIEEGPTPLFSWCGSPETLDIVMPTWDMVKKLGILEPRWYYFGLNLKSLEYYLYMSEYSTFHLLNGVRKL